MNLLLAQNSEFFNLTSNNLLSIRVVDSSFTIKISELNEPLILKVLVENKSDAKVLFDNLDLSYPLINDENLLYIRKGFSFCIFDSEGTKINPSSAFFSPALPDSIADLNIGDPKIVEYYKNEQNKFLNKYEDKIREATNKYNPLRIVLNSKSTIELELYIYFHMEGDYWSRSFYLDENKQYILKLYYSSEQTIVHLSSKMIKLSISNNVILNVR